MEPLPVEVPPHVVPVAAVTPCRRGRTTRMRQLEIFGYLLMQNVAESGAVPRPAGIAGTVNSLLRPGYGKNRFGTTGSGITCPSARNAFPFLWLPRRKVSVLSLIIF